MIDETRPSSPSGELLHEVQVLEALIENASEGLLLLSERGEVLRVNEAAMQLLGVRREDVVNRFVGDAGVGLQVDATTLEQVLSSPTTLSRAQELGAGRKILLSLRATRRLHGQPQYVTLVVRDVTGINQLVGRVQAAAPSAGGHWSEIRRADAATSRLVMSSAAMRAVAEQARQFGEVDSPVLIVGETGTGKTLFARMIHQASARGRAELREVNCGAIPAGLMESELFGYARGAFTGADARGKIGVVELANNSTLVLDEIGDLPLLLQVKLLQFLEGSEVWPVGASRPKRVNVRVIAATNADLGAMIEDNRFRRDLFYRLNVLRLEVPPLREHPEDIPPLIEMMLGHLATRIGRRVTLSNEALELLARYPFPGNVRELWNLVERLAVSSPSGVVDIAQLPLDVVQAALAGGPRRDATSLREAVRNVEAAIVRGALQRYGTQTKAAKHLGVGQATIARKARLLRLSDEPGSSSPRQSNSE